MNRPRAVDFLEPEEQEEIRFENRKQFVDENVFEDKFETSSDFELEKRSNEENENENEIDHDFPIETSVLPSGAISKGTILSF